MEAISVRTLAMEAGAGDGTVLVTRSYGRLFLAALDVRLYAQSSDALIALNFHEVSVLDGSFADQAFGIFASRRAKREGPSCLLLLRALPPHVEETLEMTLRSRPDREPGVRNCVFPLCSEAGQVKLIGKTEGHIRETFGLLRQRHRLLARDVAQAFGLDIHAASTRLKALHTLGLARRAEEQEAHGKQYIYVWAF